MWLHPYPSPGCRNKRCADLHLPGRQIADTDYLRSGNAARQQQGQQCMPCRGRYLCGKHALLQGRPHQRGSYIPLKRNCRYIVNIKAVSNTGYATEAAALTGDKTLVIATSVSAEAWGGQTAAGSGTITMPQSPDQW